MQRPKSSIFSTNSSTRLSVTRPSSRFCLNSRHAREFFFTGINEDTFSPSVISLRLRHLDKSKPAGLDGVHPYVLTECHDSLALPLSIMFSCSFKSYRIPELWSKPISLLSSRRIAKLCRPAIDRSHSPRLPVRSWSAYSGRAC